MPRKAREYGLSMCSDGFVSGNTVNNTSNAEATKPTDVPPNSPWKLITVSNAAANLDPSRIDPRESATSALPSFIEEIERKTIELALAENRFNKTRTAAQLGITFRALRYKLKKLGID